MSGIDAVAEFEGHIAERSSAGVVLAKALTDVRLSGTELSVTLDASRTEASESALVSLCALESIAHFVGLPLVWTTHEGSSLRSAVHRVTVSNPSGQVIASEPTDVIFSDIQARPLLPGE